MQNLKDIIKKVHNPELAKQCGHVVQIWDDGEITMQKSGDLLWQRNLHCMQSAVSTFGYDGFPEKSGKHYYAFVSREDAENIREIIKQKYIEYLKES